MGEDAVSVGMLIAPNDSVLAAGTFTREALASVDGAVLDVPYSAEEWYAETTQAYVFTGGTEALAEEDHHTQYAAVAYVTIRLSEKKVNFFGPRGCDPNATARPAAGER